MVSLGETISALGTSLDWNREGGKGSPSVSKPTSLITAINWLSRMDSAKGDSESIAFFSLIQRHPQVLAGRVGGR